MLQSVVAATIPQLVIFVNMDECIPNLVVTENYVVQPMESIPISMVDYEHVGIAHLVHTGHSMPTGPVIRLAPTNPIPKSKELHPLEAEIQRDFELKQKNFSRQQNSVIHSVPECTIEVVKRPNQFIQMQKPIDSVIGSVTVNEETIQLQQILNNEKSTIIKPSLSQSDHVILPQIFQGTKQMVIQGKQYIIVSENSSLVSNTDFKADNIPMSKVTRDDPNSENAHVELPEVSEIPLTVQNYNNSEMSANVSQNKSDKVKQESDSEEESDEMQPVCDYEPDPESTIPTESEDAGKPNKCYMCFKSFRQKKNMYAHIRKIHSTQPKIEGGILCPLCKMHALRQEHLRTHFKTLHDVHIEKEEKLFNTIEEFLSWKEYIERETLSLYISKSSAKLLANNQQKTYYKCHRSGRFKTVSSGDRKKKIKVQGSNKIGGTCPAAMEVTENVHGVNVIFWKTHVGHDNDLAHLVLSKEDKTRITECLSSGVPWDKILEKIKKESEKASNVPSRLTLLSKQDLRNIKKFHDMKTCPDLFPARKKVSQGRKPMKERMLRRASQSLMIEKADLLLNLLETTEVVPEFRPKICLMIDNLISTIKRRTIKNIHKREKNHKKRRKRKEELQALSNQQHTDDKSAEEGEVNNQQPELILDDEGNGSMPLNANGSSSAATQVNVRKRGRKRKTDSNDSAKGPNKVQSRPQGPERKEYARNELIRNHKARRI